MSEFVESVIDLRGYDMFKYNIALSEQQETQILANQIQEDVDMVGMESEEELMQGAVIDEDPSNQEPQ